MIFKAEKLDSDELAVIAQIEGIRKTLRFNLATPRRWPGLLRRNMFAKAIRGSNSIEGYNVTFEDAVAAAEGEEPVEAEKESWLAVTAYRNAMTFVLQLAKDPSFKYNDGFIRSLHFMMLHYDLSKNPGNWRPGAIYVKDEASGQLVYEGPDVELVPSLIGELIECLNQDERNDTQHVIVDAAMAHLNLVMIHPFSDGNGRMARCLQTLVLARQGILEPQFCSIEEYLGRNTQDYYNVLAEVGQGSWHPKNGTKQWIRFNLTAHYRQAATYLRRTKVIDKLWDVLESEIKARGLPERVIFAVADAALGYRVRNASYRNLADVNEVLASRDLKAAVDKGLLKAIGERRGRAYTASEWTTGVARTLNSAEPRIIPSPFKKDTPTLPFGSNPS